MKVVRLKEIPDCRNDKHKSCHGREKNCKRKLSYKPALPAQALMDLPFSRSNLPFFPTLARHFYTSFALIDVDIAMYRRR